MMPAILRTPALVERALEVEFQMQRNPQGAGYPRELRWGKS